MPTNKVKVTWGEQQGYRCQVWDKHGNVTEVTDIFQSVRGATGAGTIHTQLTFRKLGVNMTIQFRAIEKDLEFDAPPDVISQILQMKVS